MHKFLAKCWQSVLSSSVDWQSTCLPEVIPSANYSLANLLVHDITFFVLQVKKATWGEVTYLTQHSICIGQNLMVFFLSSWWFVSWL